MRVIEIEKIKGERESKTYTIVNLIKESREKKNQFAFGRDLNQ
jgi:hypothetical protein